MIGMSHFYFWLGGAVAGAWLGFIVADHRALSRESDQREAYIEQLQERERQRDEAQASVDQLARALETARSIRQPKDRIITKEVVRYVDAVPESDRCTLPARWRVLHDAAATGEPPAESSGVADGRAGPVADAAAIETVTDNYAVCRDAIEQVMGWQAWCRKSGVCP